jgi:hypothetical protein
MNIDFFSNTLIFENIKSSSRCLVLEFAMQKKLTLSIDAEIYQALHKMAGKRKIGRFIEKLVRPHIASWEVPEGGGGNVPPEASQALPWAEAKAAPSGEEAY